MLTPLQLRVMDVVGRLSESKGFALAGGAGLIVSGAVDRPTEDLDFFAQGPEEVAGLLPVLESALIAVGLSVERRVDSPGFARLVVTGNDESTLVDLSFDARLHAPVQMPVGQVLSLEELAADKTLALFGRAEARDFIDFHALVGRYSLDELCQLARAKDAGFDIGVFHDALGSLDRHDRSDFPVSDDRYEEIHRAVRSWRRELEKSLNLEDPGRGL